MRNNKLLQTKLDRIWSDYFKDVPKCNNVEIRFGRKAVKRLGSIREINIKTGRKCKDRFDTLILINGYFKDTETPGYIVDATIAHELCHYAQGFASPLPQLSPYPHKGGKVDKELEKRGLGQLVCDEQAWLNSHWLKYVSEKKHC